MKMMTPVARTAQLLVILATVAPLACFQVDDELPNGFACLGDAIPGIVLDVRYFGADNFVGAPVEGYEAPKATLSRPAADALRRVQASLRERGFGLKVFDAYRPQTAVDHFVRWAADHADNRTKAEYYPDVPKSELFARDYIAKKSGHSRGSTVDLTIVRLEDGAELDMGTLFDYFGPESAGDYPHLTELQRANRRLLADVMQAHGFVPYEAEWWHFTLRNEPYPETYFSFPVR
jgi:D-alanyl-D-alanine dipeptidase